MKKLDIVSIIVAAVFGAVIVAIVISLFNEQNADSGEPLSLEKLAVAGAIAGAAIQVGVRVVGVS